MRTYEINPYIRVAMPSVLAANTEIRRRIIFDYELIYVEKGSFEFFYADRSYIASEGSFIFIRPGIPHSFTIRGDAVSQPHVHFDVTYSPDSERVPVSFKDLPDLGDNEKRMIRKDRFSDFPPFPFVRFENRERFFPLFFSVISQECPPLTRKGMLTEIIDMLIRDNFQGLLESDAPYSVTHQIKDYIDAGQGLALSLDDFAMLFSYSKFYLEKSFKKAFGMGLIEYRDLKRMEYADRLLTSHLVTEVASMVGYSSIFSFSRAYKRHFGASPKRRLE